jgi:hypothetical protein
MSVVKTGVKAHDDALLAAEGARQVSVTPTSTAAQVRAADIAYARACLASCLTNNNGSGAAQFQHMLKENGVNA